MEWWVILAVYIVGVIVGTRAPLDMRYSQKEVEKLIKEAQEKVIIQKIEKL